jgi:ABC-type lipoprotein release transport system permease subunit
MIQTFKMAIRNLGRNRRRSAFSALALGMGLALLLLMAGFINGEMQSSMNSTIRLQSGHLQIRAKTYDEVKTSLTFEDLVANPEQVVAQVAALPQVAVATPRLYASGMVASGNDTLGVRIIGIDPASEANAPYRDGILSGQYLTAADSQGILIGNALAQKLNLKAGDQTTVLVNTSNGDLDQQTFTVRGIYTTHTPGFDDGVVFMPLAKAQAITQTENHASTIFVLLKDKNQTDAVAAALQGSPYQILTYLKMNEILYTTEQLANSFMIFLYLIVLGVTATVIINTLIMAVFERTREIGILTAIGMKSGGIMGLFFAESSLLAVGGILIGMALGGAMVYYFTTQGFYVGSIGAATNLMIGERIYALLTIKDAVTLTIATFVISLLAALYPALLAARLEPIQALHGGK